MSYTQINARITDQSLQLINEAQMASGGMNVVQIVCTFCPLWDGMTKTAVFYRTEDQVFHVLLENNAVLVPQEVLADKGSFFFGVLGVNGEQVRPTETQRLEVVQGAITVATAVPDPTPDIYTQLLQKLYEMEVVTDTTLTKSGVAADAAAVGDALKNLNPETDTTLTAAGVPADAAATGRAIETLKTGYIQLVRGVHYGTDAEIPDDLPDGALWLKVVG